MAAEGERFLVEDAHKVFLCVQLHSSLHMLLHKSLLLACAHFRCDSLLFTCCMHGPVTHHPNISLHLLNSTHLFVCLLVFKYNATCLRSPVVMRAPT